MRKRGEKTEDLIDEKPPNSMRKRGGKPICGVENCLHGVKNLRNLAKKTMEENRMLID